MPRDMTMTFAPIARSLISQKQPVTGVVTLNPVEAFGTINLRLPDEQARLKAGEVLCMSFPAEANTFTADGNRIVIPPSGMPDSRWGFPSGPISDSMW